MGPEERCQLPLLTGGLDGLGAAWADGGARRSLISLKECAHASRPGLVDELTPYQLELPPCAGLARLVCGSMEGMVLRVRLTQR